MVLAPEQISGDVIDSPSSEWHQCEHDTTSEPSQSDVGQIARPFRTSS